MNKALNPFDINNSILDQGRIAIEASAGTGKTYSLTVLVARHVAENNLPPDKLLLVTYTTAATSELRTKSREKCMEALSAIDGSGPSAPWMKNFLANDSARLKARDSLSIFISHFDEATITTIHGFCQTVLRRSGLSSPAPTNFEVVPDIDHIIDQVITDKFAAQLSSDPRFLFGNEYDTKDEIKVLTTTSVQRSLNWLKEAVKRYLDNHGSLLLPVSGDDPLSTPHETLADNGKIRELTRTKQAELIANSVREITEMVQQSCRDQGLITYNDMIRLVSENLDESKPKSQKIARSLGEQFPLIMVDEFQDTDVSQWKIFDSIHRASPDGSTLVTVGDPKQAIYRFRGADVNVYIDAVEKVDAKYELQTNRRSDKPLLTALDTLLTNQYFDSERKITFTSVQADDSKTASALVSTDEHKSIVGSAFEIRFIPDNETLGATDKPTHNETRAIHSLFMADVAARIDELLKYGALRQKNAEGGFEQRPLEPSDFAILVNGHKDAEKAAIYLRAAGIPAVRLKTGNVFETQSALHWQMLLGGIAHPGKPASIRTYGISWFGGLSEYDLHGDSNDQVSNLQKDCLRRVEILQRGGVTALYMSYRKDPIFLKQILSEPDGERNITDLDHIAEILGAIPELSGGAGPLTCLKVFEELLSESDDEAESQKRRIENNHEAVVILTIHSSKGLEFPIVFLPTLHKSRGDKGSNPIMFPWQLQDGGPSTRIIDAASAFKSAQGWIFKPRCLTDPKFKLAEKFKLIEKYSQKVNKEEIGRTIEAKNDATYDAKRLLYVALTRAQHKVITYWSATTGGNRNNLKLSFPQLLKDAAGLQELPTDKNGLKAALDAIVTRSHGTIEAIELSPIRKKPKIRAHTESEDHQPVQVAKFDLSRPKIAIFGYERWSYSRIAKQLTTGSHNASAPAESGIDMELAGETDETNAPTIPSYLFDINSMPMANLPYGAGFGNRVHEILDSVDPSSPNFSTEVSEAVNLRFSGWSSDFERDGLASAISLFIKVPLGSALKNKTLADLGSKDRISEMKFDFRLPQYTSVPASEIAQVLLDHGNLHGDLLDYANKLREHAPDSLAVSGFMNGAIDAVFRVIDRDSEEQYFVSDYKTNKLHIAGALNPLDAYAPSALGSVMIKDGYILQALIYSVALHRYLRWRKPDYDIEKHFGGIAYLFLRGLVGASVIGVPDAPHGVHFWRPESGLILALDKVFSERVH